MRGMLLTVIAVLVSISVPSWAATYHVAPSPGGNDTNPGTETQPFATIQKGIDSASDGDSVIVAQGTYVENIQFKGKNIVLRSTDPPNAGVVENTIIDGSKAGAVVSFSGTETEQCVLSGFTVRNGDSYFGAGISGSRSHATIQNNTVSGNSAWHGAGLCDCDGLIQNNTISGNVASLSGGGLADCDGTIRDNVISENSATVGGGLAYCHGSIENNTISGNSASEAGGFCDCDGTIQNNAISANSADCGGGLGLCDGIIQGNTISENCADFGAGLFGCNGLIQNNAISRNDADEGGGLFGCNGPIQNNVIFRNSALEGGGLLGCEGAVRNNIICGNSADHGGGLLGCTGSIQNNTIVGNSADQGGGFYYCEGTILNCIIWGNTAPDGAQLLVSSGPTYCCIDDWTGGGEGNISGDPRFVDPDGPDDDPETYDDNDYHLSPGSPCIDMGKNEDWMVTALDLDGNPRISNGTVDMGAYEYGSRPFRISQVLLEATGSMEIKWNSRPDDEYVVWSCTDPASGAWIQEQTAPSAGDSTSWTDPSPGGSQKFYRVEQL